MERVGEHPIPAGPLAVRWLAYELEPPRAGAPGGARVELENAGSAPWRELKLSYHWLDPLGNPIVWDGLRAPAPPLRPGERATVELQVRAPMPPGRFRFAFDLVLELRYWLEEVGNVPLSLDVDVSPRIERALAVTGAPAPVNQEEPLVGLEEAAAVAHLAPGVEPAPDWSRRILDAHQEGHALVAGAIDAGRNRRLAAWRPGGGRNPAFAEALLCPSVVADVTPDWLDPVEGLPAAAPTAGEPWVYDGRIVLRLRR